MTICKRAKELFTDWKTRPERFVADGAVSEQDYLKSCPKIAFILKETNDPGFTDLRKFLRNGGRKESWNNVASWVHAIRNLPSECDWSFYENPDETFRREMLGGIVVMNLKKSPGGSSTRFADLKKVAWDDAGYIREQYRIYDPDITICGGADTTAGLFQEVVHPNVSWEQTTRGIRWYNRSAHKFVIAVPHPEARVQDALLLYALLDAIKEIKQNQE